MQCWAGERRMRIFRFFITQVFLRKWLFVLGIMILLLLANFLTFTTARSIISTYQGYQQIEAINQEDIFMANLDPNSTTDFNQIELEDSREIYEYLDANYDYALHVEGFVVELDNPYDMEVTFNYMNEAFYEIKSLALSQGNDLYFDYTFNQDNIPVLIGEGLATTYPVGTTITTTDPVTQQLVNLKVQGVLEKNTYYVNFYAPNSKNYFNFSIFVPINKTFIQQASLNLYINGLMEVILVNSTKDEAEQLKELIDKDLQIAINFFTQQENFHYFEEQYTNSIIIISIVTIILLIIIVCLMVWQTLMSIRVMIKDFAIHILVGLSPLKLRRIFYSYFTLLFFVNIILLFIITACYRYDFWKHKEALAVTYGIFGLVSMDWYALLTVICVDFIIGVLMVEIIMKRVRSRTISMGDQNEKYN